MEKMQSAWGHSRESYHKYHMSCVACGMSLISRLMLCFDKSFLRDNLECVTSKLGPYPFSSSSSKQTNIYIIYIIQFRMNNNHSIIYSFYLFN